MKFGEGEKRKTSIQKDDIISALPDHVLCQILSLLPTKYAARTSVLSKRWKDLFTSVPIIDCPYNYWRPTQNLGYYYAFIYRVLHLIVLKLLHIQRFRIRLYGQPLESAMVPSLISTVVSYNVQELILLGNAVELSMRLPLPLFSCKSLVVLKLQGKFVIDVPQCLCLPLLQTLCLRYVVFCDDNSLSRILSASQVLEDLILGSCDMTNIEVFDVSSSSLKRFETHNCYGDYELFVKAPELKYLTFNNSYTTRGCSGEAFKSLLEASIFCESMEGWDLDVYFGKTHEFVAKACNAQKLLLHGDVMEGFVHTHYPWPNFHALTYLDLCVADHEGWKSFPGLLEHSPCLETLIMWGLFIDGGQFPMSHAPTCFSSHQKKIQLNWFHCWDEELAFVKYILANAKVLEKLILCPDPEGDEIELDWILEKVSAFQIYSKACQIVAATEDEEELHFSSRFDLLLNASFEESFSY